MFFRAGLKTSGMSYLGAMSALSFGIGVEKGTMRFDYSLSPHGIFGMTSRINLKMKFDSFSLSGRMENKNAEKLEENPKLVYEQIMKWFYKKSRSEKLTSRQKAVLLEKIIEKFSPFDIDVYQAKTRLKKLKRGAE